MFFLIIHHSPDFNDNCFVRLGIIQTSQSQPHLEKILH